jgi:hypothetical protein
VGAPIDPNLPREERIAAGGAMRSLEDADTRRSRPEEELATQRAPFKAYSAAERAVESYGANSAPAQTWRKRIYGSAPKAEIEWLGVRNPKTVEQEDRAFAMMAEQRRIAGDELDKAKQALDALYMNNAPASEIEALKRSFDTLRQRFATLDAEFQRRADALARPSALEQVFEEAETAGRSLTKDEVLAAMQQASPRVRETVLDNRSPDTKIRHGSLRLPPTDQLKPQRDPQLPSNPYTNTRNPSYREIVLTLDEGSRRSAEPMRAPKDHWNKDDVLVHARVEDYDAADGTKGLYVHEIQSDTAQAGRELGYAITETTSKAIEKARELAAQDQLQQAKHTLERAVEAESARNPDYATLERLSNMYITSGLQDVSAQIKELNRIGLAALTDALQEVGRGFPERVWSQARSGKFDTQANRVADLIIAKIDSGDGPPMAAPTAAFLRLQAIADALKRFAPNLDDAHRVGIPDTARALAEVLAPPSVRQARAAVEKARDDLIYETRPPLPDNQPFKETSDWVRLAIKRILHEAVEGGYSEVRFTTDALQRRLYGKEAPTTFYDTTVIDTLRKYAAQLGVRLRLDDGDAVAPAETPLAVSPGFRVSDALREAVRNGQPLFALAALPATFAEDDDQRLLAQAMLAGIMVGSIAPVRDFLTARGLGIVTQEAQSWGRRGLMRDVMTRDLTFDEQVTLNQMVAHALNPNGRDLVGELVATVLGRPVPPAEVRAGRGVWEGSLSANRLIASAADDDATRLRAAIEGLLEGQDAVAWHRFLGAPDEVADAQKTAMNYGLIVHGLTDEQRAAFFTKVQGATEFEGDILLRNFDEKITEVEFRATVEQQLKEAGIPGATIRDGYFAGELLDGAAAMLRAIGLRPDAIEQVATLLRGPVGRAYRDFANRHGMDPIAVAARVEQQATGIKRYAETLRLPPSDTNRGGIVVAAAAPIVAKTVRAEFGAFNPRWSAERRIHEMTTRLVREIDRMATELNLTVEQIKNWYRGGSDGLRVIASLEFPTLRDDDHWTLFTAVSSILSSGQQVDDEVRAALNIWRQFESVGIEGLSVLRADADAKIPRTLTTARAANKKGVVSEVRAIRGEPALGLGYATGGREPVAWSTRTVNHESALANLRMLLTRYGTAETARLLREGRTTIGRGASAREEQIVLTMLGPKIGQYFLDKLGLGGGGSTIDVWMARLAYALQGKAATTRTITKKDVQNAKQLLKSGDVTAAEREALQEIVDAGVSGLTLNDTVTPAMRAEMQEVLRRVTTEMGLDSPAAAQALAWYAIKRMYHHAGAREKPGAYATLITAIRDALLKGRAPKQLKPAMGHQAALMAGATLGFPPTKKAAQVLERPDVNRPLREPDGSLMRAGRAAHMVLAGVGGAGVGGVGASLESDDPDTRAFLVFAGVLGGGLGTVAAMRYAAHRFLRLTHREATAAAEAVEAGLDAERAARRAEAKAWAERLTQQQGGLFNARVRQQAAAYVRDAEVAGRTLPPVTEIDIDFAARVADWYDRVRSSPDDPEVQRAYRAFAEETKAQYESLVRQGVRFEFVTDDPYVSSAEMLRDVAEHNRLRVFDSGEDFQHPLLSRDENNMFRAVHDWFGHAKEGYQFGPRGEENAYRAHSAMYSPLARRVMATETRGQNSWVNYGPFGASNRADPANTRYAEQKVALMPDEFLGDYPPSTPSRLRAREGRTTAGVLGAITGAAGGALVGAQADLAGPEDSIVGGVLGSALVGAAGFRLAGRVPARLRQDTPAARAVLRSIASGERAAPRAPTGFLTSGERLYQRIIDDVYGIRKFGREVGGDRPLEGLDARLRAMRRHVAFADRWARERLIPVVEMAKGREGDVIALAKAERALDLLNRGVAEKTTIPRETLEQAVADLSQDPETVRAVRALQSYYTDLIDLQYREGLLDDDAYVRILSSEDYYTPFVREWERRGIDGVAAMLGIPATRGSAISNLRAAVRRMDPDAKARAKTVDPFEQAVLDTQATWQAVARQRVAQMMADIIESTGGEIPGLVRRVKANDAAEIGSRRFAAVVQGKRQTFEVLDEDLWAALQSMGPQLRGPIASAFRAVKEFKRATITSLPDFMLRNLIRDNAQVAIQQPVRGRQLLAGAGLGAATNVAAMAMLSEEERGYVDATTNALIGAGLGLGGAVLGPQLYRTMRAVTDIMADSRGPIVSAIGTRLGGKAELWQAFVKHGGASIGYYAKDHVQARQFIQQIRGDRAPAAAFLNPGNWFRTLEAMGSVLENAPRLATFTSAVGAGARPAKAAALAADVSIDFSRRGGDPIVQFASSSNAFFGARLQGWDKTVRLLRDPKTYVLGFAGLTAPSIALWAMIHRDEASREAYYQHPSWVRNLFWLVPTGGGDFQYFPKPFELGIVFSSIPERFLDWVYQTQVRGDAFPAESAWASATELGSSLIESELPLTDAFKPIYEQTRNFDAFRNRPIVTGEAFTSSRTVPSEQFDASTSEVSKRIGEALNVSPQRLDHLVAAYAGTTGRLGLELGDRLLGRPSDRVSAGANVPLVGSLVAGFTDRNRGLTDDEQAVRRRVDQVRRVENAARPLLRVLESPESPPQAVVMAERKLAMLGERYGDLLGPDDVHLRGLTAVSDALSDLAAGERDVREARRAPASERATRLAALRAARARIAAAARAGRYADAMALYDEFVQSYQPLGTP